MVAAASRLAVAAAWRLAEVCWRVGARAGRIVGWISAYLLVSDAAGQVWWRDAPGTRMRAVLGVALAYAALSELSTVIERQVRRRGRATPVR